MRPDVAHHNLADLPGTGHTDALEFWAINMDCPQCAQISAWARPLFFCKVPALTPAGETGQIAAKIPFLPLFCRHYLTALCSGRVCGCFRAFEIT